MRCKRLLFGVLVGMASLGAYADAKSDDKAMKSLFESDKAMYQDVGLNILTVVEFFSNSVIRNCLVTGTQPTLQVGTQVTRNTGDPIADYEAPFPRATQPKYSCVEKNILAAYLDKPNDPVLTKFLALYHLSKVFLNNKITNGTEMKHTIYAEYFLNRILDRNKNEKWAAKAISRLDARLAAVNNKFSGVKLEENRPAQVFFYETFNTNEANRFIALDKLIDDYVQAPNSMLTTFLTMAGNTWIGGEANYDDPTLLYNYLLSSYFSFRAMDLAKQAEAAWVVDPVNNKRFRLASIIGGLSAISRRPLAQIHHDTPAIKKIDDEHREWRLVNKAFHAFTVGLTFFGEEENFLEGYSAFEDGFKEGDARPDLPTVQDRPRFTFNVEGMFVGRADFAMKVGDIGSAYFYLTVAQLYLPNAPYWDYGRDAIQYKMAHVPEIAARFSNTNPNDDPLPFMVKRHKWSGPDSVCQVCHQQQSKVWSPEEKATILLPPDDILTIGTFPEKRTTWYGAIKNL